MQVFLIIQSKLQLPDTHTVQCHSVIRPLVSPRGWAVRSCQPHGTGRDGLGLGWAGVSWHGIWRHPPQHQLPPGTVSSCPLMPTLCPPMYQVPLPPLAVLHNGGAYLWAGPLHKEGAVCGARWHGSTDDRQRRWQLRSNSKATTLICAGSPCPPTSLQQGQNNQVKTTAPLGYVLYDQPQMEKGGVFWLLVMI